MIDISMDVEQYDCPFIDTSADTDVSFSAYQWDFDPSRRELETRLVVVGADRGELDAGLRSLREHPHMQDYVLLARQDDVAHVRTVIDETDAMATIRGNDGYVTGPFYIEDGSEVWHVGFDESEIADDALAALERNNEFDVVDRETVAYPDLQQLVQHAGAAMTLLEGTRELSDVERRTIEEAVSGGYFETPRSATLGELAEAFDVSKPAVSKNLRRGQQRLLEHVIEAQETLAGED